MDRLNYHHLRCFWAVAREGSIAAACRTLDLTQPTISKQIGDLEDALGESLFRRTGRRLHLTDVGKMVYAYADEIFSLGQELTDALRGHVTGRPLRMLVGVSDVVPKLLTREVLAPALQVQPPVRLICREGKSDRLLADLAVSGLDVVLTDSPLAPGARVRAFNHHLGEYEVGVFASDAVTRTLSGAFPGSLHNAPMLLPTENTSLRRSIDAWLERHDIRPRVIAEFEDSALLKAFAEVHLGVFFAPTILVDAVRHQFGVELVGIADGVVESLYAVTVERKIRHPGVTAVVEAARALPRKSLPEGGKGVGEDGSRGGRANRARTGGARAKPPPSAR